MVEHSHEITKAKLIQAMLAHGLLIMTDDIVIAGGDRERPESRAHGMPRHDHMHRHIDPAILPLLQPPGIQHIRVKAVEMHLGVIKQLQPLAVAAHQEFVVTGELLQRLVRKIENQVLDTAMMAEHCPLLSLGIAGDDAHLIAAAGQELIAGLGLALLVRQRRRYARFDMFSGPAEDRIADLDVVGNAAGGGPGEYLAVRPHLKGRPLIGRRHRPLHSSHHQLVAISFQAHVYPSY